MVRMKSRATVAVVALSLLVATDVWAQEPESPQEVDLDGTSLPALLEGDPEARDNDEPAAPTPTQAVEQAQQVAEETSRQNVAPDERAQPRPQPTNVAGTEEVTLDDAEVEAELRPDEPVGAVALAPARPTPGSVVIAGNGGLTGPWRLTLGGYLRSGYTAIADDPNVELIGRNDGFTIADARLTTTGEMDNGLGFVFQFDAGSRLLRTGQDSPVEALALRMTDVYAFYAPYDLLEINIGQFKAPFDVEDLISTGDLLFVNRSVVNRGVQNVEGYNVDGLSAGRQVGIQVRGDHFFGQEDHQGPGFSYALAATNGNGPNASLNANDRLAYFGRLMLHWGDSVALGGALFYNDDTAGDPPNRVDRVHRGFTADLQVNLYGATLLANVLATSVGSPDLPDSPEVSALGYTLQLAYEEPFFGLQPAYRFSSYDPSSNYGDVPSVLFENDRLTYHTLGLGYNARTYPVRAMANYTLTVEQDARALDNNRLDLLLQLSW
ncbi:hypothetical protein DL240_11770 [Lujinxingia litoralis]|uniref:Porin n=1 Tax=Lujinxingia litoralis TaxID=2211119 RepID=A0A328C3D8_9DELT|nr:porin [Lujinxingia litoralis]RAL21534.1 hypothetical protein DL240_11770 [Lujinxingia litoralis]